MEQRLSLITLGADDVTQLSNFYIDIFGWQPLPSSNEDITFFHLNGFQLAIFSRDALAQDAEVPPEGSGFKSFSLAYNLQSKSAVDNLFEEFQSKGVIIRKKPEEVFWGGYSDYIADPEDNLWEIAYNPYMSFDEDGNVIDETE
ncbi:VOC family protein [Aliifodinibius halophilus]|uniref:VOC family protein n=1 Tax=Fodinibius halophilus TaxID=1736908 RepID=A0A6M1TCQ0_9BACT|nr:VOC family protein [Fodinibius halophilus]